MTTCWSVEAQRASLCNEWCPLFQNQQLPASPRNGIFCKYCSCEGSCPKAVGFAPNVSHAEFRIAADTIGDAAAAGRPPPLLHLGRVLDGVSNNAEQALRRRGWASHRVLSFFNRMGNIGTEPAQLLAYASAFSCASQPPRSVCEVGLFQGHSAALFLALTSRQSATYLSIDPHSYDFSRSVLSFLDASFPVRTTFIRGLSDRVLNATKTPAMRDCDLWSLDGLHKVDAVARDARHALQASPRVRTILMDDVTDSRTTLMRAQPSTRGCSTAVDAWEVAKKEGLGSSSPFSSKCYLEGRKFGTPGWCSCWCIAQRGE